MPRGVSGVARRRGHAYVLRRTRRALSRIKRPRPEYLSHDAEGRADAEPGGVGKCGCRREQRGRKNFSAFCLRATTADVATTMEPTVSSRSGGRPVLILFMLVVALVVLWNRDRATRAELARTSKHNDELQAELGRFPNRNNRRPGTANPREPGASPTTPGAPPTVPENDSRVVEMTATGVAPRARASPITGGRELSNSPCRTCRPCPPARPINCGC